MNQPLALFCGCLIGALYFALVNWHVAESKLEACLILGG